MGIIPSLESLNRTKMWRKKRFAVLLELDFNFLLPLDINTLGPPAFGLRLGLLPSILLALRPSDLD